MTMYIEEWRVEYGRPNLIDEDEEASEGSAVLWEDGDRLTWHRGRAPERVSLACVDGVRRAEALLGLAADDSGEEARGIAGALAYGSVLIEDEERPVFGPCQVERLTIWGSSRSQALPEVPGGWRWQTKSIDSTEINAPMRELEKLMTIGERKLAKELCEKHRLTLVDGTLKPLSDQPLPMIGYIKTHHRRLLDPARHREVPSMEVGWRTSLFKLGDERFSAYVRIGATAAMGGPWAGIIRIEMFQSLGPDRAIEIADELAGILPRFAGVAHRDPRAPQNLQPVGALESHLRRLMGMPGLATRAARDSVARLAAPAARGS